MTDVAHPLDRLDTTTRILKRAQYEAFAFERCQAGVRVRNESHADPSAHTYVVTVRAGLPTACTCPADVRRDAACKHRVAVAIRPPVLAADGGGGRCDQSVPDAEEAEAAPSDPPADRRDRRTGDAEPDRENSSTGTADTERAGDAATASSADTTDDRPADCDCAALSGAFPCWPCVRAGRRTLPPD